ncbi:serine/threonine-protein kinase Chk2 [Pleuronectes platessa]|uniref:serine/threonine-protein kinase Chk2 n=1 Tax=Pleuronectes platessa TaxID=8262 RepID=UPI00232A3B24|nr:serine/threonine-protein kinase Chk2 [Pleuronectes platessa]XP_053277510.1 serine/threonine-protein kinase Chk2 [Pleuronectes platessa]XP_053277511.1 serine/threonine-protein kinase Chk2 [Pleuronectes platessa]XP_053277512.1 serine/threonine-protein kinase Chk2 [Pleuronectes platessa]
MSEEVPHEGDQPQSQSTQSTQSTQSPSQAQSTQSPSKAQSTQSSSSASSGPVSASQSSSSSGTLSSMDTIPVPLASVPEEPEQQPWGRLLPMARGFRSQECIEEQYLFGRDSKCNYVLDDPEEPGSKKFKIYSKKHFRIYREDSEVFVEDYSNNGTFVDGNLIGKNKKLPLVNNAVLALAELRNKVFVFIDLMSDDQSTLPKELQERYLFTRRIGTGVCGEVRLAFERSTCKKFAVKIINKNNFKSEGTATRNAKTEIEILQRIDHPCLMRTEDFYQTEDSFYIVLELMEGGELFHRVKTQQQLQEPVAKLYFYQMLLAVQYLHSNGIIHRDLKPENVLLSSQEDVCLIKVTDFNQSRILEETVLMRTLCGTPSYLAPEVFTQASTTGYGLAVDAWSLGVLLFVCLGGYPPFHETFSHSITDQIIRGEFTMVQSKWRQVSDQAKDVVRKLLVVDPSDRMTIEEALSHPWLQDHVMMATAHRLMYPAGDAAAKEAESTSGRKRGREGDEDDEHPGKRPKAPPPVLK